MAVVLSALERRIADEVLDARDDVVSVRKVVRGASLVAAHARRGHAPGKIRILAERSAYAAPARIVRHLHLRRIGEVDSDRRRFARGNRLGLLDGRIIPAARHRELQGKRRNPSVRDVLVYDERDPESRMRELVFLEPPRLRRALDAHQRADLVPVHEIRIRAPAFRAEFAVVVHHQLARLLLERHLRAESAGLRLGLVKVHGGHRKRRRGSCNCYYALHILV